MKIREHKNIFYEEILNAIPAELAVFDKNHKYLFVNKSAIKSDEVREWIIGKDDFDYCKKYNKPISIAEGRRAIFDDVIKNGANTLEERIRGAEGYEYYLRRMFPIVNEDNVVNYVMGYGVNISIIKQAQLELEEAKRLSVIGEFAAGIAHEVNNPLAVIHSKSQLLELQLSQVYCLDIEQITAINQSIKTIKETSILTSQLIRNLKTFSSKADFKELKYVSLSEIIYSTLKISRTRLENEGISINVNIEPKLKILANEVGLSQVFMNLIVNSSDALEESESDHAKWIKIDSEIINNVLKISFTDSGNGIPEELLDKLMQPFFTTKEPGKGTGLGLGICSKSIEKMNGKFYYNRKSKNTQFVMEFNSYKFESN